MFHTYVCLPEGTYVDCCIPNYADNLCTFVGLSQSKSTWSYPISLPSVGKILSVFNHKKMKMNLQDALQM